MTVCSTCKHANYCEIVAGGYSSQVKSCRDYRKGETTNEEWFCKLSTEEKAKWMFRLTYKCYWCGREYEKTKKYNEKECPFHKCLEDSKGFKKWLKERHHEV